MQQDRIMTEEAVNIMPDHKLGDDSEIPSPRPRLTLKYLQGLIETLQEDHHKLSERLNELSKQVESGKNQNAAHQCTEWAVAAVPTDLQKEQLPSRTDAATKESLLQELKEAARIAEEIEEHAAAKAEPIPLPQRVELSLSEPQELETPASISLPTRDEYISPILTSRTKRHHRRKSSFWSRLFKRVSR